MENPQNWVIRNHFDGCWVIGHFIFLLYSISHHMAKNGKGWELVANQSLILFAVIGQDVPHGLNDIVDIVMGQFC